MNKKVIFSILFVFSLLLVTMEFLVNPPKTNKIEGIDNQEIEATNTEKEEVKEMEEKNASMRYLTNSTFEEIGISDVETGDVSMVNTLFKTAELNPEKDGFQAVSATFTQGENVLVKVVEFQPKTASSSSRIFNIVKSRIYQSIPVNMRDKISINQTNSYGQNSFYYNNKNEFSNMVFLVIKGKDKVVAFEYDQKHSDIAKKIITELF